VWKVYYDDGTTFDSDQGPPEAAPRFGIMAIKQGPKHGSVFSRDFFIYRTDYGCWIEVDHDGLIDHLLHGIEHITAVCLGRMVPTATWKAAMKRMAEDG
jgi:hypothetical protein